MSEMADRLARALADRYTVQQELGSGRMATVYLARDLKHDRQVAVRVLHVRSVSSGLASDLTVDWNLRKLTA